MQHQLSDLEKLKQKVGSFFSFASFVTIPDFHHGFVTEFRRFKKVLGPGQHKTLLTENIEIIEDLSIPENKYGLKTTNKRFTELLGPGMYVVNPFLLECVEVLSIITIAENHQGILSEYGRFKAILEPGSYYPNTVIGEQIKSFALKVVPENHRGVITCYGKFNRVVEPGRHFINEILGEEMKVYGEIEVEDDERGVTTKDGKYTGTVLLPGRYFPNPLLNEKVFSVKLTTVDEGFVGIKTVEGVFKEQLKPGVYFQNPYLFEKIVLVNMKLVTKELLPVPIITKDTVTIPAVKSILVYQIVNARKAICEVDDIDKAIRETIKSVTNQVLSEHTVDSIMTDKIQLSDDIKRRVAENSENWGIRIERIDIKDLEFTDEMKESMSASAIAQRAADSKLITAKAEVEASKLFRQAADQLDSPAAMQMRQLEALVQICKGQNTRVLFIPDSLQCKFGASTGLMDRVIAREIENVDK